MPIAPTTKNPSLRSERGITMVEVMVTVAILTTLATLGQASYRQMENRANTLGTRSLMLGIQASVMGNRLVSRKTLTEMTTALCLFCLQDLMPGNNLEGVTPKWNPQIAADWAEFGYDQQPYDMWHRPIIGDANEMEYDPTDCRHDVVWSPGENAVWDGCGVGGYQADGDDLVLAIPYFRQTRANCPNEYF